MVVSKNIAIVMIFNTTSMKIMQYFFNNPYEQIHLRELSRKTNTSIYSTKTNIDDFVNQRILIEKRQGNQRCITPNIENQFFKQLKPQKNIRKKTIWTNNYLWLYFNVSLIKGFTL